MCSSYLIRMQPVACVCCLWPSLSPSALAGFMVRDCVVLVCNNVHLFTSLLLSIYSLCVSVMCHIKI